MFGVSSGVSRVLSYLLGLLCIGATARLGSQLGPNLPRAIRVFLGKPCGPEMDNNRLLVVRFLPGERYFLNDQPANEVHLRQLVSRATERRLAKLVWVAGDERVTYGEVAALISDLQSDTPELHIVMATESQVGPVDPVEIQRMGGKRADGSYIGVMPCISSSDLKP